MRRTPKYLIFLLLLLLLGALPARAQDSTEKDEDSVQIRTGAPPAESVSKLIDSTATLPHISPRVVSDSLVQKMKSDDAFWYADKAPHRKPVKNEDNNGPFLFSKLFATILWVIIIICFVSAIIWFLSSANVKIFRPRASGNNEPGPEAIREDIFHIDYENEIREALANADYKRAIRLYYLEALYLLSQKGIIQYAPDKTNRELADQLYQTGFYKEFTRLTRNFEFVSYGNFAIKESGFEQLKQAFLQFKHQIAS